MLLLKISGNILIELIFPPKDNRIDIKSLNVFICSMRCQWFVNFRNGTFVYCQDNWKLELPMQVYTLNLITL